jgi:hypothetical protein
MKYLAGLVIEDPCQASIDVLQTRCRDFFSDHPEFKAKHIWFIDDQAASSHPPESEAVDVIFFGGFVSRFLDSGNWLEQNYRLWCVSSAARLTLAQLLGIPFDAIQLIPRDALFPTRQAVLPSRESPLSFIFGGRLSATKNLELLIRTVYHLQRDHEFDADLILLGEFDEEDHPDRGRRAPGGSFEESIRQLLRTLDWKKPPRLIHGRGPEDWYTENFANPVYINLSTFICEDFDVSLAQVQALGWPALISDWGGHLDVHDGPGVIKIHPSLLGHAHEGALLTQLRARNLAGWINHRWEAAGRQTRVLKSRPGADFPQPPVSLTLREIDRIRRDFVRKTGDAANLINSEGLDGFSLSSAGEKFFAAYRGAFSGKYDGSPIAMLVNNFSESGSLGIRNIRNICEKTVSEGISENFEIVFVPINECLHPQYALLLAQARELVIPFWSEHLDSLLKWWTKSVNLTAPIRIYVAGDLPSSDRKRIRALLRPQDTIMYYRVDALPDLILER